MSAPPKRRNEDDKSDAESRRKAVDAIGRQADRKIRARNKREKSVWFGLGMFGLVGWAVAIPTLLGILLGAFIDARVASDMSWTLALLLAGVALGCLNAWFWVSKESRRD